jgi:hypothetical protein
MKEEEKVKDDRGGCEGSGRMMYVCGVRERYFPLGWTSVMVRSCGVRGWVRAWSVYLWVCVRVCVEEFRRERHKRSAEGRAGFLWDIA